MHPVHDDQLLTEQLHRLWQDKSGNTLALIAAALVPVLAMVGGGIDMGRSYLSQTRLQQACDAGVLAARKRLGSEVITTGVVPAEVSEIGNRFFNINFLDGAYGSQNRSFMMTLTDDYSIEGSASVDVPSTIMALFGKQNLQIAVNCQARLNFSNTDVMFVLDTTGSMAETNPGDNVSRMASLKTTVKQFRNELSSSAAATTRIRYGFVPYSTNVNVGRLLKDEWVVQDWQYQSRERVLLSSTVGTHGYSRNHKYESGTWGSWTEVESYSATLHPEQSYYDPGGTTVDENENVVTTEPGWRTQRAYYTCDRPTPARTLTENKTKLGSSTEPFAGPPSGTRTIDTYRSVYNGNDYRTQLNGDVCRISTSQVDSYTYTFEWVTEPRMVERFGWRYAQLPKSVRSWRSESNGCIEERDTYEIDDFDNVDLSRALDLDLDLIPNADPATKWRPMYPSLIYARSLRWDGSGSFTPAEKTTGDEYVAPNVLGVAACPTAARLVEEMDQSTFETYVDSLTPNGSTYHDIGMIWGGRLISPTGPFASQNADAAGKPTSRHLIFLTDGETSPLDISYASYGLEPLDQRRWSPESGDTLAQTVEKRFGFACEEVKKRNVTVWIIGFGTTLNPAMRACAGNGRYFEAEDASELQETFSSIASQIGDLRVSR